MDISKEQAVEIAIKTLKERFNVDPDEWTVLTSITDNAGLQHKFIWQEAGKENYKKYLGGFLSPPRWSVRLVKTKGKVEDRAEEYMATVDVEGNVRGFSHIIPEKQEGAFLEQSDAQALADSVFDEVLDIERENLKEISVTPKKLENRRDWTFVYADTLSYTLDKGQGRYSISIAGDKLTSLSSYSCTGRMGKRV